MEEIFKVYLISFPEKVDISMQEQSQRVLIIVKISMNLFEIIFAFCVIFIS